MAPTSMRQHASQMGTVQRDISDPSAFELMRGLVQTCGISRPLLCAGVVLPSVGKMLGLAVAYAGEGIDHVAQAHLVHHGL